MGRKMGRVELVAFDIAGTIVEDHGEVVESFGEALGAHGVGFTAEELKQWKGASKREALEFFIGRQMGDGGKAGRVDEAYATFRRILEGKFEGGRVVAIAGAAEVFEWLRERGIKAALTTGFYRAVTEKILRAAGWEGRFDAVACSDEVERGRPAPDLIFRVMELTGVREAARVMTVGDTVRDLKAGKNAGVGWNVGVLTGQQSRELLESAPHTHIVESVRELPGMLGAELIVKG